MEAEREKLWQVEKNQTDQFVCSGFCDRCGKCRKNVIREEEMQILSVPVENRGQMSHRECGIAVDIGTTTLAFALVDAEGRVTATEKGINHQSCFGADVVSRITAAIQGHEEELTGLIRRDVWEGIRKLLEKEERRLSDVTRISVAGNTVMEQLFFGFPVAGLGSYPFLPYTDSFLETEYKELYPWEQEQGNPGVTGFPCIAGFVGGDITAGLYELLSGERRLTGKKDVQFFLDIGTNGELACITPEEIIVSSTAAGPVFEGGRISCGMSSVPGAIYATEIVEDMIECKTIGDRLPEGICGSGLIEVAADMRKLGLIDRSGCLSGFCQTNGYLLARTKEGREIQLTQADIREFQMAKAAIAAGVELLIKESGWQGRIGQFVLAGGFSDTLSVRKAITTGFLPREALNKTVAAGNTALKGAVRLLKEAENGKKQITDLLLRTRHLQLAECEAFPGSYLEHMKF